MSCCRTCSISINESEAVDIFAKTNKTMVIQIELVTGVRLPNKRGFPDYICSKCQSSLKQAIEFRECLIETQHKFVQLLKTGKKSVTNHPQNIDSAHKKKVIDPLDINEDSLETALADVLDNSPPIKELESTIDISNPEIDVDLTCDNHDKDDELLSLPLVEQSDEQPNLLIPLYASNEPNGSKTGMYIDKPNNTSLRLDKINSEVTKKKRKSDTCMCDLCGKYFLCKRNLDLHQMRHTGVKNVECEFCDAKFYTISLRNLHKRQHTNPFKCNYCEETFGYNSSRLRHERIHRDERPFKCRFCEKSFRCSTSKKGHEVTHTRVRKFECKACGSWFLTNKNLKSHKRTKAHKDQVLKQETMETVSLVSDNS